MKGFLGLLILFTLEANADSIWGVQGINALVMMDYPDAQKANTSGIFLISFNPKLGCNAEVETIIKTGKRLGNVVRQEWAKFRMVITVDGKRSWSERTALTQYTNGFATTFLCPIDLLESLQTGHFIRSRMLPDSPEFEFPLQGAKFALQKARENCLTSKNGDE
jgi:hypothetical protein